MAQKYKSQRKVPATGQIQGNLNTDIINEL